LPATAHADRTSRGTGESPLFPGKIAHWELRILCFLRSLLFQEETLKFDLLVDGCLLVELKAIHDVLPIHKAQLLSYMKLLDVPLGLLFNFHEVKLVDGISRLILPSANKP